MTQALDRNPDFANKAAQPYIQKKMMEEKQKQDNLKKLQQEKIKKNKKILKVTKSETENNIAKTIRTIVDENNMDHLI